MHAYLKLAVAMSALLGAVPASAAEYLFGFTGLGRTASGTLTTTDTAFASRGYQAVSITGITGTINGLAITGLNGFLGSDNLYYLTGPSFLDGSGLGFTASDGSQTSLYYQDFLSSYRITTFTGGFGTGLVTATSSAVAAAAVPEPASWALMLGGFGAIGGALRSRRKTAIAFA